MDKTEIRKSAICVFCGSSYGTDPAFRDAARAVGAGIAKIGHALVFGGGSPGLMGDVARAARGAGTAVEGILPGFLRDVEPPLTQGETTEIVPDLFVRKQKMMDRAAGFIVLPGGLGTYDEFFEVLTSAQLGVQIKPIILVNVNGYFDPLEAMLQASVRNGFVRKENLGLYRIADSADAALAMMAEALR
ncbi:MAG: TIGR00730 family Rossman fold protein [Alphaproteobacteria bacterium]|nr:TIGR00730 family Rossman fold protein [Alphaproteobacteria bacterium]